MSKKTYTPQSTGTLHEFTYLDHVVRKVTLTDGAEQQPEYQMLLGFHPKTGHPIYLKESQAEPVLPEVPQETGE